MSAYEQTIRLRLLYPARIHCHKYVRRAVAPLGFQPLEQLVRLRIDDFHPNARLALKEVGHLLADGVMAGTSRKRKVPGRAMSQERFARFRRNPNAMPATERTAIDDGSGITWKRYSKFPESPSAPTPRSSVSLKVAV